MDEQSSATRRKNCPFVDLNKGEQETFVARIEGTPSYPTTGLNEAGPPQNDKSDNATASDDFMEPPASPASSTASSDIELNSDDSEMMIQEEEQQLLDEDDLDEDPPEEIPLGNNQEDDEEVIRKQNIELFCALLARHHCTASLTNDLLQLLHIIMPDMLPKSRYYLFKYLQDGTYKKHYVCTGCNAYCGTNPTGQCVNCEAPIDKFTMEKQKSYILTMELAESIRNLCEHTDILNQIEKNKNGIKSGVQTGTLYAQYQDYLDNNMYNITLTFGTDGGKAFKSRSSFALWPIFVIINEIPPQLQSKYIILHSLWYGGKPNPKAFFNALIKEANKIGQDGITISLPNNNQVRVRVKVILGVMDAPARAHMQNIKQYNGRFGCGYCMHSGEVIDGVMRYPLLDTKPPLRTRQQVLQYAARAEAEREPVNGVKGFSPLANFAGFDLVQGCPPDIMHAVYLGVTRKIVMAWFDPSFTKLATCRVEDFDRMLLSLKPPSSIIRCPRSMKERSDYKASEWKSFLMYYAVFILSESSLPPRYVKHFYLLKLCFTYLESTVCKSAGLETGK